MYKSQNQKKKIKISIFDNISKDLMSRAITSNGKRRNFDLLRDIQEKRKEIKNLLKLKIQGEQLLTPSDRIPTPLLKFRNGLKNSFFSFQGIIFNKLSSYRRALLLEYIEKKKKLNKKIDAGALTYFFLKGQEEQTKIEKKRNNLKKRILTHSSNYNIVKDNDLNVESFKKIQESGEVKIDDNFFEELFKGNLVKPTKKISNLNLDIDNSNNLSESNRLNSTSERNNSNRPKSFLENLHKHKLILKRNLKENKSENENSNNQKSKFLSLNLQSMENNNSINDQEYYQTSTSLHFHPQNINHTDIKSYTERSLTYKESIEKERENLNFIKKEKKTAKSLQKKIDLVNKKQIKLEKKLFKIIDRSNYIKPLPIDFIRDAEAIGQKIKKHKSKRKTRIEVYEAVKFSNKYTRMGKDKANMIKYSDNILKLDDVLVNKIGKRLQESYWMVTGGKKENRPLEMKIREEKIMKMQRDRFNKNNELLEKMRFNFENSFSMLKSKKYKKKINEI